MGYCSSPWAQLPSQVPAAAVTAPKTGLDTNQVMLAASLVYAVALLVIVLVPSAAVILVVPFLTGVAWVEVLSTVNAMLQRFLPSRVRGGGLSIYQPVLFGAQVVGALLAGVVAGCVRATVATFALAAAALVAGAATRRWWPVIDTHGMDLGAAADWPTPLLGTEVQAIQ
jgi:hypothetical protein